MIDEQFTIEKVEELENVLRLVKRGTRLFIGVAVLLVVALALTSFGFVAFARLDAAVGALSREAASNQQQAKDAQRFLSDFLNEENYVCQISGAYAVQAGLPTPKPGECTVKLPTPRPSPTPAPTASAALPRRTPAGSRPGASSTTPPGRGETPTKPPAASPPASATATPVVRLPSLPPLPSLPLSGSANRNATPKHRCGPVAAVIAELLHGRRC